MRTAPLIHGTGPFTHPGGGDAAYMAALPPELAPAACGQRYTLGYMVPDAGLKYATHLRGWLAAEAAAGRMVAHVSFWPNRDLGSGQYAPMEGEIVTGQHDAILRKLGAAMATYPGKIYFVIKSECNANSSPQWTAGASVPFVFPMAFRRIAAILNETGAVKVLPTWHVHPAGLDPWASGFSGINPWAYKLYPGDKYVKAFALSIYDPPPLANVGPQRVFVEKLCSEARARGKPVIFGEASCALPGVNSINALTSFFGPWRDFIEYHEEVEAVFYGNHDWRTGQGFTTWRDGRLLSSPDVWAWWLDYLKAPYFQHGKPPVASPTT